MARALYAAKALNGQFPSMPTFFIMRGMAQSNCSGEAPPRCSPANLARSPCVASKKSEKGKIHQAPEEKKSMWENPECCADPCPDVLPRFDDLYYKPSDKAKRAYCQTWVECPELLIKPKKICCFENVKLPPLQKRILKKKLPPGSCPSGGVNTCKRKVDYRCPKISMDGCKEARDPPTCKPTRSPSNCKKMCTPYPSFSECTSPKPKPLPPQECKCLNLVSMCEVWAYFRKRQTYKGKG